MKAVKIAVTLLLLLIASSDTQITYLFPEDRDIRICPAIMSSVSTPSFRLQPSSSVDNQFLVGSYVVSSGSIQGARFDRENNTCETRSGETNSAMCSKLSLLYSMGNLVGRGTFTVTYHASNRRTRKIHINYGDDMGIYLQTPGQALGRVQDSMNPLLNGSLLVFGAVSLPLALCYENGTAETRAFFIPHAIDDICSSLTVNDGPNTQPGRFDVTVLIEVMGQPTMYVAAEGNCSSAMRSTTFKVILDPAPTTEGTEPTTPATTGPTVSQPTSIQDTIIGVSVCVVGFVVVVLVVSVSLVSWYQCCHKKKRRKNIENGSPGNRSKSSSTSTEDGHDGPPSGSPTLLISKTNGHVQQKKPGKSKKKKLYVIKYKDSKAMATIEETLAELNEESFELATAHENGTLPTYMTNIIQGGHRVIILDDHKELKSQSESISRRWINELQSFPIFTKMSLDNVFIVHFGCSQPLSILQELPRLQRIPIAQHPDDDSRNFDPTAVAKLIQDEIDITNAGNPLNQQQGLHVPNNLPPHSRSPSTGSRTPAQSSYSTPHVIPNDRAEHSNEQPSAATPDEPSQSSLTSEDETERDVVTAAIEAVTGKKDTALDKRFTITNPRTDERKASTPANTRAATIQNEESSLKSSSAPSMIQVEKSELKHLLKEVVQEENRTVVNDLKETVRKQGEEIKDKVGREGEEIKDKVGREGEEIKDKVGREGDEIKEAVAREGEGLQDSIGVLADEMQQSRADTENQNFEVVHPCSDDDEGKEEGELDSAATREDTA